MKSINRITIVIRTYNEAKLLLQTLTILNKLKIDREIIIIDSKSTDNTTEVASKFNAKVIEMDNFSYGSALNTGIKNSHSDLIAILSGHCFIQNKDYFDLMISHFNDSRVAGVYARQIPASTSNILDKRNLHLIYWNSHHPREDNYFNNAASLIRKSVWERHPFNEEVEACEDIIWAQDIIQNGYKIIYEPNAIVQHLHNESVIQTIERYKREYEVMEKFINNNKFMKYERV